jgi:hypothetical protein
VSDGNRIELIPCYGKDPDHGQPESGTEIISARDAGSVRFTIDIGRVNLRLMYYPDLGSETMIVSGPGVRAIGWLEQEQPFPIAETPFEFHRRLAGFARDWSISSRACHWPVCAGPHVCSLCGAVQGYGEFAVPGDGVMYVAPYLISHYVEAHGYCPPSEFIEAVVRCPPFESAEYSEAVRFAWATVFKMSEPDIRAAFECELGSDRYREFLTKLHGTCEAKQRLLYWQNEAWEAFARRHNLSVSGFAEVSKLLRCCPLHQVELQRDVVPIVYGTQAPPSDPSIAKERLYFPYANEVAYGSCREEDQKEREIFFCSECRRGKSAASSRRRR